jgi:predicted lactoylglutathione lyase
MSRQTYIGLPVKDVARAIEFFTRIGLSYHRQASDDRSAGVLERAVAAGGQAIGGPVDQGPMYMRAFLDLDGHRWSLIHFDSSAMPGQ